jgi:hypothetical protein
MLKGREEGDITVHIQKGLDIYDEEALPLLKEIRVLIESTDFVIGLDIPSSQ